MPYVNTSDEINGRGPLYNYYQRNFPLLEIRSPVLKRVTTLP